MVDKMDWNWIIKDNAWHTNKIGLCLLAIMEPLQALEERGSGSSVNTNKKEKCYNQMDSHKLSLSLKP